MRMGRLVWGVMVLILGGCSANSMIVRNYDGGALPAQQVAQRWLCLKKSPWK